VLCPLIAALRTSGHTLGIVLSARNAGTFAERVFVSTIVVPWRSWKDHGEPLAVFGPQVLAAVSAGWDFALIATEEWQAYRLAAGAGIPQRRGFDNGWAKPFKTLAVRRFCTQTVHRPAGAEEAIHEARVLFRLGRDLVDDLEPTRDPARLAPLLLSTIPARATHVAIQATSKWLTLGVDPRLLTQALEPHARERGLVLLAHTAEASFARDLNALLPARLETFDEMDPWKRAIASAAALVTPDTGAAHLAGMVGTPTIDCFPAGPDDRIMRARWSPWAAPARTLAIARGHGDAAEEIAGALAEILADVQLDPALTPQAPIAPVRDRPG
jgi:ADP-heptose:LPS heptosyltransferase